MIMFMWSRLVTVRNVQLAATPKDSPNLQLGGLSNFSGDIQLTRQASLWICTLLYTQLQTGNYTLGTRKVVEVDHGQLFRCYNCRLSFLHRLWLVVRNSSLNDNKFDKAWGIGWISPDHFSVGSGNKTTFHEEKLITISQCLPQFASPPPSLRYLSSPTRWQSQPQQVPPSTLPMPLPVLGNPGFQQQSVSRPSCHLRRLENHMTLYCNVTVSGKSHSELNKCGFFMMYGTALYAACLLGVTTNKCVFQHFYKDWMYTSALSE